MNHKVRHMKRKSFLEKTWGWGFGSCQEVRGSDCGGVQVLAASWRLRAICNSLKVPQEGSSASPPCPLFPQKAFSKVYPVIDGFTSRDSLDLRKEKRSGCHCLCWKSLVTDGTECGILEKDIHIWTGKEDEILPSTARLHRKWAKSDILCQGP